MFSLLNVGTDKNLILLSNFFNKTLSVNPYKRYKNDDEIIEFQEEHFDQKYVYRRTTDIAATGYIETNFEISIE